MSANASKNSGTNAGENVGENAGANAGANDGADAVRHGGADRVETRRKPARWGRRIFLIGASVVGGGLAVGGGFVANKLSTDRAFRMPAADGAFSFGAWLTIGRDGRVTVAVPNQEMGQGIMTTIPMLVAEELDADPARVVAVQAPVAAVYANVTMLLDGLPFGPEDHGVVAESVRWTMDKLLRALGVQATGGSTSTRNAWMAARQAGAAARAQLLAAAAARWNLPVEKLSIVAGQVREPGGRSAGFGELVEDAAKLPLPANAPLREPSQYKLIGKGMARTDVPAKSDGSAQFGIDVRLPGMKYAAIRHAPVFGGSVASAALADKPPGVLALVNGGHFVAVIADNYWLARKTLAAAKIDWNDGPNARLSSASIFEGYAAALDGKDPNALVREYETRGDKAAALSGATPGSAGGKRVKAEYRVPFQAHAAMEPLNCTVWLRDGTCDIWAGNQAPTLVKWLGAGAADLPSDKVNVHTPYLGGGFGRRADLDFVREAVVVARAAGGVPVKTVWSREEDMQHDVYRPAVLGRFEAALGDKGEIQAWKCELAGPSVTRQFTSRIDPRMAGNMPDKTNVEGATRLPYHLPNLLVRHAQVEIPVPVGFWRSVGHSFTAFFVESFIDECAQAAGVDPLQFRLRLLAAAGDEPMAKRFAKLLQAVADAAGWDKPLASVPGHKVGRGIAIAESFGSIVAQVAEVQVDPAGAVRCTRVFAAVDCGIVVDPVIARAQVASAIHFGLSAALSGRIDIEAGRVKQSNFTDFPVITLPTAPRIEVIFVVSGASMGGIGEVGTPPIAPAVANAVFAATGRRAHEIPLASA